MSSCNTTKAARKSCGSNPGFRAVVSTISRGANCRQSRCAITVRGRLHPQVTPRQGSRCAQARRGSRRAPERESVRAQIEEKKGKTVLDEASCLLAAAAWRSAPVRSNTEEQEMGGGMMVHGGGEADEVGGG